MHQDWKTKLIEAEAYPCSWKPGSQGSSLYLHCTCTCRGNRRRRRTQAGEHVHEQQLIEANSAWRIRRIVVAGQGSEGTRTALCLIADPWARFCCTIVRILIFLTVSHDIQNRLSPPPRFFGPLPLRVQEASIPTLDAPSSVNRLSHNCSFPISN
jgi:hypothetical protein